MKKLFLTPKLRIIFSAAALLLLIISCQKDISHEEFPGLPDLATKVNSSVSGFVTDENNLPVQNASVLVGSFTTTTDEYGYFEARNVQVVKTAATVTVSLPGYFKGIKTYRAEDNKSAFFRIKLIPKITVGTFSGITGGNVSVSNGLNISFPSNAIVNASGATYIGSINVIAHWIDPTSDDIDQTMPGDLRAIDANNSIVGLITYGMAGVELAGTSGESLQIAPGKQATITFPLPAIVSANAPATIPLWHFDEVKGLWIEEGSAVKTGSSYVGNVSHFSWWNCDLPNAIVPLTFTVVFPDGSPAGNMHVEIVPLTPNSWSHAGGYTDSTGYVSIFVTPNTLFNLTITGYCGTTYITMYSQNFNVGTSPVNLGNITLAGSTIASIATITGTVTDCTNSPVSNGYIMMQKGNEFYRYSLTNTGTYNFSFLFCSASPGVNLIGEDAASSQQSTTLSHILIPGVNAISDLQACGVSTTEFINYTIDAGTPVSFITPIDTISQLAQGSTAFAISARNNGNTANTYFSFTGSGIGPGSIQSLNYFFSSTLASQPSMPTSIPVNITEYGAVGQFVSGNFSGILADSSTTTTYNINCNFRVRRQF